MYWDNPHWLLLSWVLPVMAGMVVYAHRRRAALATAFAERPILPRLIPLPRPSMEIVKTTLLLLGISCLIVGLARPRWGLSLEKVQSRGVDLFVLLDVSRSMLAEDVGPNRLARAKSDIRDLLSRLTGDRVGLIVFAGSAVVKVPLTTDQGFFLTALDDVDTTSAPRGGSLIGDAIRKALEALPERTDRDQVLIIITDGEDHDSFPLEAAGQAAQRGVKIFTVGLGDSAVGHRIPVRDDDGHLTFLKQDGQEVFSKMDERLLQELATTIGGAYVPARTRAYDLGTIYEERLAQLTRREISSEKSKRLGERFQIFLVTGFVLLLLESLISRYPRRTDESREMKSLGASPPG